MSTRPRAVVAFPNLAERTAVAEWLLSDGIDPVPVPSAAAAEQEIRTRGVDVLIADARLADAAGLPALVRSRNALAFTVLVGGHDGRSKAAGVAYLTRPLDRVRLSCVVWMDILDRRPFRRSVRKAVNRFEAVVNGVPSHIVDVSADGVRIELPKDWRSVLPVIFSVRVPLVGISITAQRMWMRTSSPQSVWCGGALATNRPGAAEGWRAFVDMVPAPGDADRLTAAGPR